MKRELFENVYVRPYTSGTAVEKDAFLSAILGIVVGTAGALTITVTHGDTDAAADTVTDTKVFPGEASKDGVLTVSGLAVKDVVNLDVDLLALKKYVKFTVSGAAAASTTLALAMGDAAVQPV